MKLKLRIGILIIALILTYAAILFVMGCAGGKVTVPNWSTIDPTKFSAKQMSDMMMMSYNMEYELYKTEITRKDLTENEKGVLAEKKKILLTAWPLIFAFDSAAVQGQPFDPVIQQRIISMLSSLIAKKINR